MPPGPDLASHVISRSPEERTGGPHVRTGAGGEDDATALGEDPQRASNGRPIHLVFLHNWGREAASRHPGEAIRRVAP